MPLLTRKQKLKQAVGGAVAALVGRRRMWRLGRALYRVARNDVDNDPARNGERWLQAAVLDLFRGAPRVVVFDVGANVGDWTRMLLDQAPADRVESLDVYAFEPVTSTFQTLRERLGGHPRFARVHSLPLALSDAGGTVEMYEVEPNGTTNSLHPDPFQAARRVAIETQTADTFCARNGIGTLHLLKVDAEGHDCAVLRGAAGMFEQERVMVAQFEYNHRWVYARHYLKDVFDLLGGLPYVVGKLTPGGMELYDGWHFEMERFFEANYVILHRSVAERLPALRGTYTADDNTYA
ncbi:MAG TPA: FkbM family methyltransferase [Longimicrobium sp.]|nr:FkbM family methyltransferase [Longimicrobium sp.]